MTTRRFSAGVTSAVRAQVPKTNRIFGRMVKGDLFKVPGEHGKFRFLHVVVDDGDEPKWVRAIGPIDSGREQLRSFAPDSVTMPSQRALNAQRRRASDA